LTQFALDCTDVIQDGASGTNGHQSKPHSVPSLLFLPSYSTSLAPSIVPKTLIHFPESSTATTPDALINAGSSSDQCYGNNDPGARKGILSLASSLDPSFSYTACVPATNHTAPVRYIDVAG